MSAPVPPQFCNSRVNLGYAMDPEFEAELKGEGIPDDLIAWMATHCKTPARFAFYVDSKEEIQTLIVDQVASTRNNRTVRAALVELWRKHSAAQERRLSRAAAGIGDQDWEDPLEGFVRDRLYAAFAAYYHFRLRPTASLCDNLLARFKRELDRKQFTVVSMSRVRSQACAGLHRAKRLKVSDTVSMDIAAADDDSSDLQGVFDYIDRLQLVMTGWAVVGCFEVRDGSGSLRAARWLPWDLACEYVDRAKRKLLLPGGKMVDLGTLQKADESTREMWVDLMRNNDLTMGQAVEKCFVDASPFWLFAGAEVAPAVAARSGASQTAERGRQGSNEVILVKDKDKRQARPARIADQTSRGKSICALWNEGKCQAKCPDNKLHVCNFLLQNGHVCAAAAHRRSEAH